MCLLKKIQTVNVVRMKYPVGTQWSNGYIVVTITSSDRNYIYFVVLNQKGIHRLLRKTFSKHFTLKTYG